jgi:hypothetical protein
MISEQNLIVENVIMLSPALNKQKRLNLMTALGGGNNKLPLVNHSGELEACSMYMLTEKYKTAKVDLHGEIYCDF